MSHAKQSAGDIFEAALELPPAQRAACVQAACAGNETLRLRVEALLRAHESAGAFMVQPAAGTRPALTTTSPAEQPGDRIGRYKLLQQIGEGGCGTVYLAAQDEPVRRQVALKVIKLGMDTKNVIARFEAERQALALMDHPNIAKVMDAGATETGRPYFVMELVRGIKITDYCDENSLSTEARLRLFIQVCQAIQHAHQKGIIHRDIKPSNILVADHDGVPVSKIIDFGIAKATTDQRLTDKTLFTALEQFLGTPAYMSPEQARLSGLDIDTRSDIYSLGVLLYELLTARTPFEARRLLEMGLDEIRRTIREEEPLRPSSRLRTLGAAEQTTVARQRQSEPPKLVGFIRGDLDWIVMKCLEKDRARRYETANGLAMDIQRHLDDEPVVARPPSNYYRLQKTFRRNRVAFIAAVIVLAAILAGSGIATVAAIRLQRADHQIRQARDDAREQLRTSLLAEARALRAGGQSGRRFGSLDAVRQAVVIRADALVRNEAIASLAVSDLRVAKEKTPAVQAADSLVCFDFNLDEYAVGDREGNITIRAATGDAVRAILPAPGLKVRWIRWFSPDARFLRVFYDVAGEDETYADWVWDLKQQRPVIKESLSSKPTDTPVQWTGILAGNFSSDSRLYARCHPDGAVSIWDLSSGQELTRFPGAGIYNHLILSPKNTRLACASETDPVVEIRDLESSTKNLSFTCPGDVTSMAWSSDGQRLATGCRDFHIYLWDTQTGQRLAAFAGPTAQITALAFDHSGHLLANSSWDGQLRLWDADSGLQIASYPGGSWQLQFSADDRQLLGWQYVAHYGILEVADSREFRRLSLPRSKIVGSGFSCPNFSGDGRILAAAAGDAVHFWDAGSGQQIASLPVKCDTCIFQPDGQGLIFTDWTNGVRRRALSHLGNPASQVYRLEKSVPLYDGPGLDQGAITRDGHHLAFANAAEEAFVLDLVNTSAPPIVLRPDPPLADRIAISPDGHWIAISSWNNNIVQIWDARAGELAHTLSFPGRTLAVFSPDGHWLATSTSQYQLWEVGSWQPKSPPRPGCDVPQWNFTAFSPDGQVMARTLEGNKIQILETLSERSLAILEAPDGGALGQFQFSPGGDLLAAMQQDQQVQLWDLRLIRQDLRQMHLDWDQPPYAPIEPAAKAGAVTLEIEPDSAGK